MAGMDGERRRELRLHRLRRAPAGDRGRGARAGRKALSPRRGDRLRACARADVARGWARLARADDALWLAIASISRSRVRRRADTILLAHDLWRCRRRGSGAHAAMARRARVARCRRGTHGTRARRELAASPGDDDMEQAEALL